MISILSMVVHLLVGRLFLALKIGSLSLTPFSALPAFALLSDNRRHYSRQLLFVGEDYSGTLEGLDVDVGLVLF